MSEEEKIEITSEEKIKLLEANNKVLAQQNRIFQMGQVLLSLQQQLISVEREITKTHDREGYIINSDYILIKFEEVK